MFLIIVKFTIKKNKLKNHNFFKIFSFELFIFFEKLMFNHKISAFKQNYQF